MEINPRAPVVISRETVVPFSPGQIWNLLTDIKAWNTWFRYVQKPSLAKKKEPLAQGSQFRWQLRTLALISTITAFDSPRSLGWKSKGSGTRAITLWTFEPVESGTLVRIEHSMQGLMVLMFKDRTLTAMEDVIENWLTSLRQALQNQSKHPETETES